MSFSRLTSIVATLVPLACGGGDDAGPSPVDQCPGPSLVVRPRLADVRPDAAPGAVTANITGDFSRTITGPASAFSRTLFPAFLVADAFTVDAAGRPTGELFIFAPGTPAVGNRALVPITLEDVRDPNFIPRGPFVVWAEAFDNALTDYSRWFLGDSGTLGITTFRDAEVGRVSLTLAVSGTWRSATGARLGCGRITGATIDA